MAITIRARQGTQIGYKGTSGGSVSWINQAGQAGRQMAATGQKLINASSDIQKFFNDEVSESEVRQQVDDMQVAYLKQSRGWNKSIREGGAQLDENGNPTVEFDPNHFTDISNQNHDLFWKDQVEGKGYDPRAVSAFGVYFQNKGQEAFNKADQYGMKHRYAKLKAKDNINVQAHLATIANDPLVENKKSAFDALTNMSLSGAPHRDGQEWKGIMSSAHTSLVENIAITNAYGQQGRNLDPSDLVNGYTEQDYSNAIKRINVDKTLTNKQKTSITAGMKSNRTTRIAAETTARATANSVVHNEFSQLFRKNKLTADMVNKSTISEDRRKYWIGELEGGTSKPWKADYNDIKLKILSGTWSEDNDIARTPHDVVDLVVTAAGAKGLPPDEIEKLMKDVEEVAKASPITAKKSAARVHAKSSFTAKLSMFEKLMLGQSGKGVMAKEAQAAADNKLWKYDTMMEQELKEGRKNGLTWSKMLSPNSPDYIVNDIIDTINAVEPDVIDGNKRGKDKKTTLTGNVIEAVNNFDSGAEKVFSKITDLVSPDAPIVDKKVVAQQVVDSGQTIHKVYGRASYFPLGTTPLQAKAQTDSSMAEMQTGDARMRVVFDSDHPGYSQYSDGRETMKAWKERMAVMGYDITERVKEGNYSIELQEAVLTDSEVAAEMERIANEIESE